MKSLFSRLDRFLKRSLAQEKFPGAVCYVEDDTGPLFFECRGDSQKIPRPEKMTRDTIFDLASLTKPLATALAVMILYERRQLRLTDCVQRYLGILHKQTNGRKTIRELLTHSSGIPAWHPTYLLSDEERWRLLGQVNTGNKGVIYSCLGYIILGKIVEAITASRLDEFCNDQIFKPLGLKNTGFGPVAAGKPVAANELGNRHEKKLASKYGNTRKVKWRNYLIRGEVHDGNAFYGYQGVAGNAGLFSNARELGQLLRDYAKGRIVRPKTVQMMTRDLTGNKEKRGLGWVIDPYPGMLTPRSFGHTGFTGTMCAVDPETHLTIILFANVHHPRVRLNVMPQVRRQVVGIVAGQILGIGSEFMDE